MAKLSLDSKLVRECAYGTGFTADEVISIAATGPRRYKVYQIPKKNGGLRTIAQPSRELKSLQYFFLSSYLESCPVHPSATAYVKGKSITVNAAMHLGARAILKVDFSNFFPSIRIEDWQVFAKHRFPEWTNDDRRFASLVLFYGGGSLKPSHLSIGAPTSPAISNIMMASFDFNMTVYCHDNAYTYSRYADDITISSAERIDAAAVLNQIRSSLARSAVPRLRVNDQKTKLFSKRRALQVTGLVLANQGYVSLGRDRKRLISSMIHHWINGMLRGDETEKLRGLLAFAKDAEPAFLNRLNEKYGRHVLGAIAQGETPPAGSEQP